MAESADLQKARSAGLMATGESAKSALFGRCAV